MTRSLFLDIVQVESGKLVETVKATDMRQADSSWPFPRSLTFLIASQAFAVENALFAVDPLGQVFITCVAIELHRVSPDEIPAVVAALMRATDRE